MQAISAKELIIDLGRLVETKRFVLRSDDTEHAYCSIATNDKLVDHYLTSDAESKMFSIGYGKVKAFLEARGYREEIVKGIYRAVSEALRNSNEHGHHRDITKPIVITTLRYEDGSVLVQVLDQGNGFDIETTENIYRAKKMISKINKPALKAKETERIVLNSLGNYLSEISLNQIPEEYGGRGLDLFHQLRDEIGLEVSYDMRGTRCNILYRPSQPEPRERIQEQPIPLPMPARLEKLKEAA